MTTTVPTEVDRLLETARSLTLRTDAFIDGTFVPALAGRRFDCTSPRDGQVLTTIAEGDRGDIDRAVRSARRAFEDGRWTKQHPRDRRRVLQALARLIEQHGDELALLESLDMGKPVADARAVDIRVTVQCFDFYAEAIDKRYDEVAPTDSTTFATITREPYGVVAAIVPWNFPLMLAAWKLAPALAVGNSVVLKPAEASSLTAIRLAELAAEAGLPDGVLNVVPGFGATAGAALGLHPDVDAITFTGSGPVGRTLLRASADSNLKEVSLELGGKSAQLVLEDATGLDNIAVSIASGIFFNQGEVCSAGSRLVVHRSRKDELIEHLLRAAAKMTVGDPLDPQTSVGALVEEKHLHRVLGYIATATDEGATTLTGGSQARIESGGYYVEPTIFDNVTPEMTIANEEVFGPVLSVLTFDDIDEGVRIANSTQFGLAAAVWTTSLSKAHLVSRALRAGTVWVNNYDGSDITVPFGGYKQSGFGAHDKSLHALDKYTTLKSTWMKL
ncbi:aldehyde dehydrogenase [Rhodococcus pseudokoreensis]|uniref:Aldehyde dehydrogenase n=1 Tax=Rhodococcus pseudokoreensis TaxID=2811421 RepID=A0A974VYU7_9NOCA|nr:aldehyde dehydrogenase [Rhodococcus pseudokoreensis]QSE88125.1 aldehyde dehydrogenase [Rhodococcus pseudokoreensis]